MALRNFKTTTRNFADTPSREWMPETIFELTTTCASTSITSDITLLTTRRLSTSILQASITSDINPYNIKTLTAMIPGASVTPDIDVININYLPEAAAVVASSVTPDIDAALAPDIVAVREFKEATRRFADTPTREWVESGTGGEISFSAGIMAASVTPDISQVITRAFLATVGVSSVTPNITSLSDRDLTTSIVASSLTPDISVLGLGYVAAIVATSVTPDIDQATIRYLFTNMATASQVADALCEVERDILAAIVADSDTPTIDIGRMLVADIPAISDTPDTIEIITERLLSAIITSDCISSDIDISSLRPLDASIPAISVTSNAILIAKTLGTVIDLTIVRHKSTRRTVASR
jgi:hypothetical protein